MENSWNQAKQIGSAVRRRGGRLMLLFCLLLCAWILTAASANAADNTYLFEVSTGAATGDESKIDFFIITYTTEDSGTTGVSKLIFPKEDAWTNTYDLAASMEKARTGRSKTAQEERDEAIISAYGYSGIDLRNRKPTFQSYTTDQYLFTTEQPIRAITRVQVFAGDSGSWPCQGMRIFRVNQMGGLYRWNTASSDCYIDFAGELIAEALPGSANVSWKNDKLVSTSTGTDISLRTSGFDSSYVRHELQNNTDKTIALRMDFADTYGAGLEALSAMSIGSNTLQTMGLAETMAVTVYYNDRYGLRRAARVPAVLNAAEYTAGLLSGSDLTKPISGLAQQGEGLALGVFLPEFASLRRNEGIVLTLGEKEARAVLGSLSQLNGGLSSQARQNRTNRVQLSETDTASVVTMAVYDLTGSDVRIGASVNDSSGAIRYTYSGDPTYYQPVSSASGDPLIIGDNLISLREYEHGKLLAPRDKTERYLIELTTDDVQGAGTKDDIYMSINWTDLEGNRKSSGDLNLRELSRDFNGFWVSSAASDPGYYRGVARGQTLRLFVPLTNVKTITDVKVWMADGGSHDDWQMKNLTISTVGAYDKRAVVWQGYSVDGVTGSISFDRAVEATEVYRFTDTAVNPVLVQQESMEKTDVGPGRSENNTGGNGGAGGSGGIDVTSVKKVDWSQIRYAMTFQQASQNLAFGREQYLYAVTVNVGKDEDALASDGDCGSKNLFYFRLVFRNGSSGFVLANQQLSGDSFISGASQTFYISTNEDYGDVTAVQIIPEDNSSNSDLFDKLNIESIEIKRESNSALVPVWTVNEVGWISIDYRDEGQMVSVTGMAGRTAEDLTRTYAVDGSTFDVNFMLAIQTEAYPVTEGYPEGGPQFEGSLAAVIYYDSYSPSKGYEEISDVTKSMYSYMNRTSASSSKVGGRTISDPSLMFRADHTDRFFFSLSDVHSIKRIELQAYSAVNTTWNISDVSLFMVNGTGSLILNSSGEYQRVYRSGEELTWIASGTSENSPKYHQILQAYDESVDDKGNRRNDKPATINISFTENSIEINEEAKQWTSVMSREPVSENDTLNLFLYPQSDARVDPTYSPVATIQYTTVKNQTAQSSTGDMRRVLYNDQPVLYATGLNASQFGVLNSVVIYSGQGSGIQGSVRAVVQQVRSGVVIRTWELSGSGYTDIGGIVLGTAPNKTTRRQRVQLQLGTDVERALLSAPNEDLRASGDNLAVALWYRGDDPSGMELRSPYIYLTDQGYTELRPGQVIDLAFGQKNVAEIIGLSVVGVGEVTGSVEMASIMDEEIGVDTGTVMATKGVYGFTEKITITNAPRRVDDVRDKVIKRLSMAFTTALSAADDVSAGTSGPVRMTVGYYDRYGDLNQRTYEDIRPYITSGETGFLAGTTVNVEMLLPDVADLRWVELEPYSGEGAAVGQHAMWTLESLTVTLGDGELNRHSATNQQIVEGTPLKLNMADILMTANVFVDDEDTPRDIVGGSLDLLLESGSSVQILPRLIGSYEGYTATLSKLDTASGATGKANLDDTRGYTQASLAAKAEAATDSREKQIWNSAQLQPGTFETGTNVITFTPPRNYTDKSMSYQIKLQSVENGTSTLVINVTVENETDPVAQQLEELARTIEAERLEEMQRRINELENTNDSGTTTQAAGGGAGGGGSTSGETTDATPSAGETTDGATEGGGTTDSESGGDETTDSEAEADATPGSETTDAGSAESGDSDGTGE